MKTLRLLLTSLMIIFVYQSTQSQSVKKSIDGNDIWGAWMVKGTSKVWLVDQISERGRLWDYQNDKIVISFNLREDVKNFNLMNDGSLAYISHNSKNEYIILKEDGSEIVTKFKQNAPSYYIHPDGKYFLGSIFEGFITYTFKGKKVLRSKLNETITGYSSKFLDTSYPDIIFRYAKDVIQKVDIAPDGSLSATRAFDKNTFLLNEKKDGFMTMSPVSIKCYSLPDISLKSTYNRKNTFDFTDAIYDSEESVLYYFSNSKINKLDVTNGKLITSVDMGVNDLYFEDRVGNTVVGFSDSEGKFYIINL